MVQGQLSFVYYSSGGVICQRVMTNEGDRECSAAHVARPTPASNLQFPRPWLPPGLSTSLPDPPDPRFPGRRCAAEVLGCGVGTGGSRALSAPGGRWAALCFPAARDFCGVMVTWRFRHGVFQAPRQGPETPPLWASLWVAGCLPIPEPLIPAGPTGCQAAQLRGAEPFAFTAPGSQLLC